MASPWRYGDTCIKSRKITPPNLPSARGGTSSPALFVSTSHPDPRGGVVAAFHFRRSARQDDIGDHEDDGGACEREDAGEDENGRETPRRADHAREETAHAGRDADGGVIERPIERDPIFVEMA